MSKKGAVKQYQVSENGVITVREGKEISDDGYMTIEVPATASGGKVRELLRSVSLALDNEEFDKWFEPDERTEIDKELTIHQKALANVYKNIMYEQRIKEELDRYNYLYGPHRRNNDDDSFFWDLDDEEKI